MQRSKSLVPPTKTTSAAGDLIHQYFGVYDYVIFKDQWHTYIRAWRDISPMMRKLKVKEYSIVDGFEAARTFRVPRDGMNVRYLVLLL